MAIYYVDGLYGYGSFGFLVRQFLGACIGIEKNLFWIGVSMTISALGSALALTYLVSHSLDLVGG